MPLLFHFLVVLFAFLTLYSLCTKVYQVYELILLFLLKFKIHSTWTLLSNIYLHLRSSVHLELH